MEERKQAHIFKKIFVNYAEELNGNLVASRDKLITRIILLNGGGLASTIAFFLNPLSASHPFRITTLCFAIGLALSAVTSICDYIYDQRYFKKFLSHAPKIDNEIPANQSEFFKKARKLNIFERGLKNISYACIIGGCLSFFAGMAFGCYDFLGVSGLADIKPMSAQIECPPECSFLNSTAPAKKEEKAAVNSKKAP